MRTKTKVEIRVGKASRQTALIINLPDDLRDKRSRSSSLGYDFCNSAQKVATSSVLEYLKRYGLITEEFKFIKLTRMPEKGRCGEFVIKTHGRSSRVHVHHVDFREQRVRFKAYYA